MASLAIDIVKPHLFFARRRSIGYDKLADLRRRRAGVAAVMPACDWRPKFCKDGSTIFWSRAPAEFPVGFGDRQLRAWRRPREAVRGGRQQRSETIRSLKLHLCVFAEAGFNPGDRSHHHFRYRNHLAWAVPKLGFVRSDGY